MLVSSFKVTRNKNGTVCVCSKKPADKVALLSALEKLELKRLRQSGAVPTPVRKPRQPQARTVGQDYYLDSLGRRLARDDTFAGKEERKQMETGSSEAKRTAETKRVAEEKEKKEKKEKAIKARERKAKAADIKEEKERKYTTPVRSPPSSLSLTSPPRSRSLTPHPSPNPVPPFSSTTTGTTGFTPPRRTRLNVVSERKTREQKTVAEGKAYAAGEHKRGGIEDPTEGEDKAQGELDSFRRLISDAVHIEDRSTATSKSIDELTVLIRKAKGESEQALIDKKKDLIRDKEELDRKAAELRSEANGFLLRLKNVVSRHKLGGLIAEGRKTWSQLVHDLGHGGKGTGDSDHTMYDTQINKILDPIPGFQGCFAVDQIGKVPISATEDSSFVLNSDPSSKPGQHWIGVWISPIKTKSVEIFDSLAEMSPLQPKLKEVIGELRAKVDALHLPYRLKLKTNTVRDQRANSTTCGWFATHFILDRARGKSYAEASHFKGIDAAEASLKPLQAEFKYL